LSNKAFLMSEAERLYVYEFNTIEEVASKLRLSTKTISRWKLKEDWEYKQKAFLKSKQSFHEELYELARNLIKGIKEDMAMGEKVDPGRMYAFCKIIPLFAKVKDYEDLIKKPTQDKPKGLTPDIIARIEQDVLGIPQQTESEDEEQQ